MERDPHQLIEGCLIAAYAIGVAQVFLYVRGEMAHAQERIAAALNEAYAANLVGKNILGTDFSVDIVLHWGAGAYIVGEETALIESPRGQPRHAAAQAAVLPRGQGPLPEAHHRQQRRDAVQPAVADVTHGVDEYKAVRLRGLARHPARRGVGPREAPRASTRSPRAPPPTASSSTTSATAAASATTTSSRCSSPAAASAPWFFPEQVDLPLEGRAGRRGGLDARLGRHRRHGRDHRRGAGLPAHRALLRPRVVRQVHAVPRGHDAGRRRSSSASSTATVVRPTSTPLLDVADNISPGPYPVAAFAEAEGLEAVPFPPQPDHDLPAGPVVGRADHLGHPPLPPRVRGEDHQARPRSRVTAEPVAASAVPAGESLHV